MPLRAESVSNQPRLIYTKKQQQQKQLGKSSAPAPWLAMSRLSFGPVLAFCDALRDLPSELLVLLSLSRRLRVLRELQLDHHLLLHHPLLLRLLLRTLLGLLVQHPRVQLLLRELHFLRARQLLLRGGLLRVRAVAALVLVAAVAVAVPAVVVRVAMLGVVRGLLPRHVDAEAAAHAAHHEDGAPADDEAIEEPVLVDQRLVDGAERPDVAAVALAVRPVDLAVVLHALRVGWVSKSTSSGQQQEPPAAPRASAGEQEQQRHQEQQQRQPAVPRRTSGRSSCKPLCRWRLEAAAGGSPPPITRRSSQRSAVAAAGRSAAWRFACPAAGGPARGAALLWDTGSVVHARVGGVTLRQPRLGRRRRSSASRRERQHARERASTPRGESHRACWRGARVALVVCACESLRGSGLHGCAACERRAR